MNRVNAANVAAQSMGVKAWKPENMSGITIVSDPGLDDLLALALLDKLTSKLPKQLVATFGNMNARVTSQNASDFVSIAKGAWQYRQGAAQPLAGKVTEPWIDQKQGANGLWDIRPRVGKKTAIAPAVQNDWLISLATFTEIKAILQKAPVTNLLIMGGLFDRFRENGNVAELNVRLDVEAANWVFENLGRTTTMIVPAEVAFDVSWPRAQVESIAETSAMNTWLKQMLLAGYRNGRYAAGNELYDPLAVFLAFYPECAEWRQSGVAVVAAGKECGRTVLDKANPVCDIAVRVRRPELTAQKIFELIFC